MLRGMERKGSMKKRDFVQSADRKRRRAGTVLLAAAAGIAFLLSGCGGKIEEGKVAVNGSTSMGKVIGALGEAFQKKHPGISFAYDPTGSGSGITAVYEKRCDIGLSSRNLKEEEEALGLMQTLLAYDGISLLVHPDNQVENLDMEQIAKIFTGKIQNWKEVGGADAQIILIGREAGSGTRDGFESVTGTNDLCKYREELASTGDVVTAVAGNPAAIGYASMASAGSEVKQLSVGGVFPGKDTVWGGSYVLQRPFLLVTRTEEELSETAKAFWEYALSEEAQEVISAAGAVSVMEGERAA